MPTDLAPLWKRQRSVVVAGGPWHLCSARSGTRGRARCPTPLTPQEKPELLICKKHIGNEFVFLKMCKHSWGWGREDKAHLGGHIWTSGLRLWSSAWKTEQKLDCQDSDSRGLETAGAGMH